MSRYLNNDPEKNYGRGYQRWVRCRFCNTLNDLERVQPGEGQGYEVVDTDTPYYDQQIFGSWLWKVSYDDTGAQIIVPYPSDPEIIVSDDEIVLVGPETPEGYEYVPKEQISTTGCMFCGSRNFI